METNKYIIDFQKELLEVPNQTLLIEIEIKEIEKYTTTSVQNYSNGLPTSFGNHPLYSFGNNIKTNSVFKFKNHPGDVFNSVFYSYLLNDDFDFNTLPDNRFKKRDTEISKLAIHFAEYYKWLKELNPQTSQKDNNNKKLDNINQKILALHYLGLKMNTYETLHFSKILAGILDVNFENIRKNIPHIYGKNGIKTKKNLKKLQELFENQNFKLISKKIEEDLNDIE